MSTAAVGPGDLQAPVTKGRIFAWGVWDWGSAAFNAVIVKGLASPELLMEVDVTAVLPGDGR